MKRSIVFLLILTLLFSLLSPVTTAASAVVYGDLNEDDKSTAEDALTVLKSVVGKVTLTEEQTSAGDVNLSGKVDATDALMILQFVVGKIDLYPAQAITQMTEEEQFYYRLNQQYKATFADFSDPVKVSSQLDPAELVEQFGGDPAVAPVDGYTVTANGKLCYTPLSNEAKRLGNLAKYNIAQKVSGSLQLGGTTLTYSMPKDVTAYDVIPINYSVYSSQDHPIHVEAVAFEEPARNKGNTYYDANLAGTVDMTLSYEGYVVADNRPTAPYLSPLADRDVQGSAYPNFEASELVKSGTLKVGDYTWLKFKYTNTGDTILDGDGNSAFRFAPHLYKYQDGGWVHVGDTPNLYYPLLDYVYPGESGEFWALFNIGGTSTVYGLEAGDYKVEIDGYLRTEGDTYPTNPMAFTGGRVTHSSFEFSVTEEGAQTTPNTVKHSKPTAVKRNNWLANFEEFMSSYSTLYQVGKSASAPTKGVLYLQVAPFTEEVVLKVMHGNTAGLSAVHIPVTVDTDSVSITLNPYNNNYVIQADGTRTPMVMTQNMVDMRGNIDRGPNCADIVVNDLRNMKEAGINTLTTTHAYTGHLSGLYDMSMFMLDCARKMDFSLEGQALYYYRHQGAINRVRAYDKKVNLGSVRDSFGMSQIDAANGILARWNLLRYGDFYHYDPVTKTVPIAVEDNFGWMNSVLNCRFGIDNEYSDRLLWKWLEKAYNGDIAAVNEKYDASYSQFRDITVSDQGTAQVAGHLTGLTLDNENNVYHDWNAATMELDVFRTTERVRYYTEMLRTLDVPNTKVSLRSENMLFLAGGISQTTSNPHYRHVYYDQRRAAMIPEILAASDIIYADSSYACMAFTDREVYELTRQAAKTGFVTAKTPSFNHMWDPAINDMLGSMQYDEFMSLGSLQKSVMMARNTSLFTYWKAMYEAGGIPGTMWMDYNCDLYVTTTQYKEMQFFKQKVDEMLSTEEGKAWATSVPDEATQSPLADIAVGAYSYPEAYIEEQLNTIPRINRITSFVL